MSEKIIKCKTRVQKHGEVFTPIKIVKQMLDQPGVKEACENLTSTFLEPAVGEGVFLVEILERKLKMVARDYNKSLEHFENYSLLALSTIYGVELLEDNTQACVMNIYLKFYNHYKEQAHKHNGKIKQKVLNSANKIIALNIANGNFLTRKSVNGEPIIFSKWEPENLRKNTKNITVQRTEYTLDEIYENVEKSNGQILKSKPPSAEQMNIFSFLDQDVDQEEQFVEMKYVPVQITDVYKEEMEEV